MEHAMRTLPTEIGEMGADGIGDIVRKETSSLPLSAFAESPEPPISWEALSSAGWDTFGVLADGDGATTLDLATFAKAWGYGSIPLPLLTSIIAKRHCAALETSATPLTFALPYGNQIIVPFGSFDGVQLVSHLGSGNETADDPPAGEGDTLDLIGRGRLSSGEADLTEFVAREVAVVFASEAVGGAERLLADTVAFVKDREQFGRPVGSFQAVKHKLADAAVAVESADTATIWASERPAEAFRGALFAVDKSIDLAETAIQAHGGLGFTWEVGLHFILRRMLSARRVINELERRYG